MPGQLRWLVCVALVSTSGAASAVTIQDMAAGVGALGGVAAAGPDFVARTAWIVDAAGNADGVANPGEHVVLHVLLRNAGSGDAFTTRTSLTTDDPSVDITSRTNQRGVWPVNDTWASSYAVVIDPAADPHDVTAVATVTASNGGPWRFIVTFTIAAQPLEFVKLDSWVDDPTPGGDGDGQAAPGERLHVGVRLRNVGSADGSSVRVTVASLDPNIVVVVGEATHPTWPAGEERDTLFVVDVSPTLATGDVPLFISVVAEGVDPWQFSMSIRVVGRDPEFEFRNFWVYDPEPGGNRDGLATPGERVRPRLRLRNVGIGDGQDVQVTLTSADSGLAIVQGTVTHATWPVGAARNNGFVVVVRPTATQHTATLLAEVRAADGASWQFTVTMDIQEPRVEFSRLRSWLYDPAPGGNRDRQANRGERVRPIVRLRQNGPSRAVNVRVTVDVDDPKVTVAHGEAQYSTWWPGESITLNRFAMDIGWDAVPHDVTVVFNVSADNGGPWQFTHVFPIVYRPVDFERRTAWVFDPAPGGDRDGQAEAGERVLPRVRMRSVGVEDTGAVTVRLKTNNPDVTVVSGEVSYATWEAGVARNSSGFVVDISRLARPQTVDFAIKVEVDGGGTWSFRYLMPIVSPAVQLAAKRMLVDDGRRGNRMAEPGETVSPTIRLLHIGTETATGLRATLVTADSDITITDDTAGPATLSPGSTWEIKSFALVIDPTSLPRDAVIQALVAADNGGPWRFDVTLPIGGTSGVTVRWGMLTESNLGGNDDGRANAGETVALRFRVINDGERHLRDVQTVISTDDPDVTLNADIATVDSWLPGYQARRDFRLTADIDPEAEGHTVAITLTITADEADPLIHTWRFPIITLPPDYELRNSWVWDRSSGANADGDANPGERVHPRVRIKNVGQGVAHNVRAELLIFDDDVEVVSGSVSHDSWPSGEARNNNGFVLDIADSATPHDVQAVLSVIADDSSPWTFSFTFPIVASEGGVATSLLANFPNPFNPETWIPFDLSEDADVTVSVYDARGVLTRRLDLGRLPPGAYRGRSSAAYWDGRNGTGEQVASGVYLYELRAGGYREMRRRVVRKCGGEGALMRSP